MLAAMGCFALSDALLKLAAAAMPAGQIMAVRGVFSCLLALGLVAWMGDLRSLRRIADPIVLSRGALEGVAALTFILALAALPLANVTAIILASPLMMAFVLATTGVEIVGWRRWTAILIGFLGVLLIVRPGVAGFSVHTLLALACAVCVTARDLITRRIAPGTPSSVIAFATTPALLLVGVTLGLSIESWRPVWSAETALLAAAAVFLTGGNYAIIVAFRGGEASAIAPFRYSVLPMSMMMGLLVFSEFPDALALIGMALILGSGLYAIHRERVRARQARADASRAAMASPEREAA